jgi:hypothetical protein
MWTVYYNPSTRRYTVAQHHPHGFIYAYGPASWDACWAYIRARGG